MSIPSPPLTPVSPRRPMTPPVNTNCHLPSTPPPNPSVQVKLTLPTPPSFSAHRRSQSIHSSPNKDSPQRNGVDTRVRDGTPPKKGHNRSVSFSTDVQIKTMSPEAQKVYKIPQRIINKEDQEVLADLVSPRTRRGPPSALILGARPRMGQNISPLMSPFRAAAGPKSAPLFSLGQPKAQSRFASTAAARGINIDPALAKLKDKRHSTQGMTGMNSIWSAGLTASGGWITPGLSSARSSTSTTSLARARGLSVAVIKDGREMIVESGPITPGLQSGRDRSLEKVTEDEVEGGAMSPQPLLSARSPGKPKEIILCRYHHTPGLTCTSRPCRFVHDLSTVGPTSPSVDPTKLRMLSPTKTPDLTMGTFARAQDELLSPTRTFTVKDGEKGPEVELGDAVPGETVLLTGAGGAEMAGTVYYMSGGGKGPAGKAKTMFKTVKCRDFEEGYCAYGEQCSFIHEEIKPTESKLSMTEESETKKTSEQAENEKTNSAPAGRPETVTMKARKERPAPIESAWRKGPPKATHITKDGLSAFAPPYSAKPVSVGNGGELQQAQVVHSPVPMTQAPTVDSSVIKSEPRSVWAKAPPAIIKTVVVPSPKSEAEILNENQTRSQASSQEVEIEPPTPSFSHLMPPTSAWTVYSTDSDPAGPWDPAVRRQQSPDIPPIPQHYKHHQQEMEAGYPWGMPMMPVPMVGYEGQAPQYPGGAGVLWTPNGWAVQDAAMKRALNVAEKAVRLGGNVKLKARGNKSNYRKRPCRFFAEGNCPHGDQCTYLHVLPTAHQPKDLGSDSDSAATPTTTSSASRAPSLPCKFFNSQSGCFNGESCTFLHALVIPTGAYPVERPRPWRTRPCRHFQLGKCNLGDTCHFAHVADPNFELPAGYERTRNTTGVFCTFFSENGVCPEEEGCRYIHFYEGGRGYKASGSPMIEDHSRMEERVEKLMKMVKEAAGTEGESDEEEDDDDVEIVNADTSLLSTSPLQT